MSTTYDFDDKSFRIDDGHSYLDFDFRVDGSIQISTADAHGAGTCCGVVVKGATLDQLLSWLNGRQAQKV